MARKKTRRRKVAVKKAPTIQHRLRAYVWEDSGGGGGYQTVEAVAENDLDLLPDLVALMTNGQPYSEIRITRETQG